MKKKLISLAMLVTVFAMQVVGVSAASKTTGMAVAGESKAYYKAQEMPESMLEQVAAQKQEYADLIKQINAGTKTGIGRTVRWNDSDYFHRRCYPGKWWKSAGRRTSCYTVCTNAYKGNDRCKSASLQS